MKYNGVIENKLRIIEQKLGEIRSWDVRSFEKFKKSSLLQNACERALQVAIEVMIDISERILALEKISPLNSAAENVEHLQKMGILKSEVGYTEMIRFRNFIVHRYEKVDIEIVYNILHNKLVAFESFVRDIRNF
ncbi:MAG: DUF86 domain-containing protein [Bacteroidetes bacterium]|nr:DUF86 domain-containing protein [Bacteroidota bacterium]